MRFKGRPCGIALGLMIQQCGVLMVFVHNLWLRQNVWPCLMGLRKEAKR